MRANKFMNRKGGVTGVSVEIFLSHSAQKFDRRTILCCFRKFLVAKKLMEKTDGSIEIFRRMFFCVTGQRNFIGEQIRVSLIRVSSNCMLKMVIS